MATSKIRNNYKIFGRSDYIWNDYSKISKKNIDHVVTQKVITGDDKAIECVKKKIIEEEHEEEIIKDYRKFKHDLIH